MMTIATITGQTLEEFFRHQIPQGLITPLENKLTMLKIYGRECIGAFVFSANNIFHFEVTDPNISEGVDVYISFIDISNLIIVVEVLTFQQSM